MLTHALNASVIGMFVCISLYVDRNNTKMIRTGNEKKVAFKWSMVFITIICFIWLITMR